MILSVLFEGESVNENYGGKDAKILWKSYKKSTKNEIAVSGKKRDVSQDSKETFFTNGYLSDGGAFPIQLQGDVSRKHRIEKMFLILARLFDWGDSPQISRVYFKTQKTK